MAAAMVSSNKILYSEKNKRINRIKKLFKECCDVVGDIGYDYKGELEVAYTAMLSYFRALKSDDGEAYAKIDNSQKLTLPLMKVASVVDVMVRDEHDKLKSFGAVVCAFLDDLAYYQTTFHGVIHARLREVLGSFRAGTVVHRMAASHMEMVNRSLSDVMKKYIQLTAHERHYHFLDSAEEYLEMMKLTE